jgi:hypothetical protein
MKSTQPLSMALCGIPACAAEFSSWASVMPPTALISHRPSVPSDPVPERTTPIDRPWRLSARERNRKSTGRCGPCASRGGHVETTVRNGDVRVRWNHIDVVRLHSHAGVGRHVGKELSERVQAARGGADADNRERIGTKPPSGRFLGKPVRGVGTSVRSELLNGSPGTGLRCSRGRTGVAGRLHFRVARFLDRR